MISACDKVKDPANALDEMQLQGLMPNVLEPILAKLLLQACRDSGRPPEVPAWGTYNALIDDAAKANQHEQVTWEMQQQDTIEMLRELQQQEAQQLASAMIRERGAKVAREMQQKDCSANDVADNALITPNAKVNQSKSARAEESRRRQKMAAHAQKEEAERKAQ